MTRASTIALALAALAVTGIAIAASTQPIPREPDPAAAAESSRTPRAQHTPAPPTLAHNGLDRQDRVDRRRRTHEAAVYDRRPLLTHLPLKRAGVRIDIVGLAPDGTALLTIVHHGRSQAHARTIYRRTLAAHADTGRGYTPSYKP
jgi:hypothetical protein